MVIINQQPATSNQFYASSEQVYAIGVYGGRHGLGGYPEKRMILDKIKGCSYVKIRNIYRIYANLLHVIRKFFPSLINVNTFGDGAMFTIYPILGNQKVDLIHTFNRILLNENHKWVATVETTLPAFFSDDPVSKRKCMKKRLKHILSDNCKAIMPMSKWAYDREIQLLSEFASHDEMQCVQKKMKMLYPPQKCFFTPEDIHKKCQVLRESQNIRFIYVGRDFVRKGGEMVLRAFDELSREYKNFSVVAVGNTRKDVGKYNFTEEKRKEIMQLIEKSCWLQYYESLPNDKVIELAKEANVGLLPTFGDTFGFSILEMQACGCPMITTNGEARPEINDNTYGWMIDTKNLKQSANPHENIEIRRSTIISQMKSIVRGILEDPSCIEQKALRSVERIVKYHDPEKYSDDLKKIYALCR